MEAHLSAVGLNAKQCGEINRSRWSMIGYDARILPSVPSIRRTGVSRTLLTKQNVSGARRDAEGYHRAAFTESG